MKLIRASKLFIVLGFDFLCQRRFSRTFFQNPHDRRVWSENLSCGADRAMAAFCAVYRLIWLTALTLCNAANILISLCLTQPRPGQPCVQCVQLYTGLAGWRGGGRGIHPPSTATQQQHRLGQRSVCSPACDWSVEIQSCYLIGCS